MVNCLKNSVWEFKTVVPQVIWNRVDLIIGNKLCDEKQIYMIDYMIVTTKNNTEQHEIMFKVKYNFCQMT